MPTLRPLPAPSWRERLALASYWLLFVFVPLGGFLVWRGVTPASFVLLLPLFLVLSAIGERVFRWWRRLWGLP